jgi:hypothetical protein
MEAGQPMKRLFLCLALGALPAFCGGQPHPGARITLYTEFQEQPPDRVVQALEDELESVFGPTGLHVRWRSLAQNHGDEVSAQLAVIRFKGKCDVSHLEPTDGYSGPLGWTHLTDGVILPFSSINCDGIRIFTRRGLLGIDPENREEAYGRALARVLAHELYHILANTTTHATWGIARAAYTVHELLSQSLQFEPKQCEVLRQRGLRLELSDSVAGQ